MRECRVSLCMLCFLVLLQSTLARNVFENSRGFGWSQIHLYLHLLLAFDDAASLAQHTALPAFSQCLLVIVKEHLNEYSMQLWRFACILLRQGRVCAERRLQCRRCKCSGESDAFICQFLSLGFKKDEELMALLSQSHVTENATVDSACANRVLL